MDSVRSFYFKDGPYLGAIKALYEALQAPEACLTLSGAPGSGKSRLCRKLRWVLRQKQQRALYFSRPLESPEMLRNTLARALRLPRSANFQRLLEAAQARYTEPLVLILDDVHLFNAATLQEVRRLLEAQVNDRRLLKLLLCGDSSLHERLRSGGVAELLLNVTYSHRLQAMEAGQLERFVEQYLARVGVAPATLEPAALRHLLTATRGYPGPVAEFCRLLLIDAASDARYGASAADGGGEADVEGGHIATGTATLPQAALTASRVADLIARAPPGVLPASNGLWASSRQHLPLLPLALALLLISLAVIGARFAAETEVGEGAAIPMTSLQDGQL